MTARHDDFRTLDGQPVMAERRKYTATDVGRAYTDGLRHGGIIGCTITAVVLIVGMLVVRALGGAL